MANTHRAFQIDTLRATAQCLQLEAERAAELLRRMEALQAKPTADWLMSDVWAWQALEQQVRLLQGVRR